MSLVSDPAKVSVWRERFARRETSELQHRSFVRRKGSQNLFVNRRGDRLKILHWDGSGFWIYYRVLEQGTFEVPRSEEQKLTIADLLQRDDTRLTLLLPDEIPQPVAGDIRSERTYEKLCDAAAQGKPSLTARMWAYRAVNVLHFNRFTISRHAAKRCLLTIVGLCDKAKPSRSGNRSASGSTAQQHEPS